MRISLCRGYCASNIYGQRRGLTWEVIDGPENELYCYILIPHSHVLYGIRSQDCSVTPMAGWHSFHIGRLGRIFGDIWAISFIYYSNTPWRSLQGIADFVMRSAFVRIESFLDARASDRVIVLPDHATYRRNLPSYTES